MTFTIGYATKYMGSLTYKRIIYAGVGFIYYFITTMILKKMIKTTLYYYDSEDYSLCMAG